MPDFRILVLSDLHAHQVRPTDGAAPSYLSSRPEFSGAKTNPLEDAIETISRLDYNIDWVVCPGDLCDKNDIVSASVAWGYLENVRRRLHARRLVGTVGNHDVDSRREDETNLPDDSLRNLTPGFPLNDQRLRTRYWANHYLVCQDYRVNSTLVLLNTCVLHGAAVPGGADPEHRRGYLTEGVINKLASELPRKLSKFNVLVMHHHVRQHPWLPGENSHAMNGPKLLEILKGTGARWLVIHGHQHLPNLGYWDDSPNAPVVLSAGSVAAKTYAVQGRTPRNQMHLIAFDGDAAAATPTVIRGRVFAWNWAPTVGWTDASWDSGLPRICGFGERGGLSQLVDAVRDALERAPARRLTRELLAREVTRLEFLTPDEVKEFIRLLLGANIRVLYDEFQIPVLFELGS